MFQRLWTIVLIPVLLGLAFALMLERWRETNAPLPEPEPEPEPVVPDVATTIERRNRECVGALERGDAKAYVRDFTEETISMPGHGPIVRGRKAIESAIQEAFRRVRFLKAEMLSAETRVNGLTAYETGTYRFVVAPSDNGREQTLTGRYLIVWKRIAEEWKIVVDAAQPGAPLE